MTNRPRTTPASAAFEQTGLIPPLVWHQHKGVGESATGVDHRYWIEYGGGRSRLGIRQLTYFAQAIGSAKEEVEFAYGNLAECKRMAEAWEQTRTPVPEYGGAEPSATCPVVLPRTEGTRTRHWCGRPLIQGTCPEHGSPARIAVILAGLEEELAEEWVANQDH